MSATSLRSGAERLVAGLEAAGVTLAASVPDTWIGTRMAAVRRSPAIRAVDAAREDEAVAVACGTSLAGGRGAVLIQNAGLFNSGGVLTGLVDLYRIPCFFIAALLVLDVAFDPSEPIPPYSERPDAIRARFKIA